MAAALNERIFREYDIRGLVGKELDAGMYEGFGKAFGTMVLRKTGLVRPKIAVGRDNRANSKEYSEAYVKGLASTGCDAVDIGELTTPAVYFANFHLKVDACSAITASHNPPEYNGCKFRIGEEAVSGLEIKPGFLAGEFASGKGEVTYEDIRPAYIKAVSAGHEVGRPVKVVADCGNGVAGYLAVESLRACGCEVIPLFCDSDPAYPNHHPNPVKPENYPSMVAKVKETRADLGIMFDGDGDRMAACDENGNILWPDTLLMLFARKQLARDKGGEVVVEIKCALSLIDDIANRGGHVTLCSTGYPYVEKAMAKTGARVGGEMSGHYYFYGEKKWFSDAIYAACELVRIISNSGKTLSELVADAPKYHASQEYRLHVGGENGEVEKVRIVEELTRKFKETNDVIDIDGARVLFEGGWGLVRYSKNEPELSMRFESKTKEGLAEIMAIFRKTLEGYPVRVPF